MKLFHNFKLKKFLLKFNVPLALSRNSVLLCIKTNLFGLASKIYSAVKDSHTPEYKKFVDFWVNKIGGNEDVLIRAVKQGMKVEFKHHANKHKEKSAVFTFVDETSGYRWSTPSELPDRIAPAVAAPAVAAAPLIVKIGALLKSLGIDTKDLGKKVIDLAKNEAVKIAEHAIKKGDKPEIDPKTGEQILDIVHPADEDHPKHNSLYGGGVPDFKGDGGSEYHLLTSKNNSMLFLILAVLAVFLIFK